MSACAYVDMNIIYTEQGVTLTPDYDHSEKTDPCQEQHKYVTWAHNNELALTFCKAEWYCSGLWSVLGVGICPGDVCMTQ